MTITTTLADIRKARPCRDVWAKLLVGLGCSHAEAKNNNTPLPVEVVLDHCGVNNALWVIDNVICDDYLSRCIAADMAEISLPIFEKEIPDDDRPRKALEVARDETSTIEEREAAWKDAEAAAEAVTAGADVWAAAWATTRAAAAGAAAAGAAATWAAEGTAVTTWERQAARLRLYLKHGIDAKDMRGE